MKLISDTQDLAEVCARLKTHDFITVDTEFMREKTYWPILCLVQVASMDEAVMIDPLAKGLDLAPLLEVLADPSVLKVFHAARQDLEIFFQLMGKVPAPLFDTQIAAMALGYGDQVGYEALVREITRNSLDKGSRFTDWSQRPLSEKQLTYALGDVTYLRDIYRHMRGELKKLNREKWIDEEMAVLADPAIYHVKPAEAWCRLKLRHIKPRELGVVMKLAEWREATAQKKDLPRGRVLKDDAIFELARSAPDTTAALAKNRSIPNGFERSGNARGMLDAIKAGKAIPQDNLPTLTKPKDNTPVPADILDLLRVLLKRQCETYNVAPKLLASASDLEQIARYEDADVPAMRGWRRQVYGDIALKLKAGNIALQLKDGQINLIDVP